MVECLPYMEMTMVRFHYPVFLNLIKKETFMYTVVRWKDIILILIVVQIFVLLLGFAVMWVQNNNNVNKYVRCVEIMPEHQCMFIVYGK